MGSYKDAEKVYKKVKSLQEAIAIGNVYDPYNSTTDGVRVKLWGQLKQLISIPSYEGSYILREALDRKQQIEIILTTVIDLLSNPNTTNLHCHHNDDDINNMMSDIWLQSNDYIDQMIGNTNEHIDKSLVLSKVRWITLGYQYDWTSRTYSRENYVPFPVALGQLCKELTASIYDQSGFTLNPEAAIINFYQNGNIMGGHKDDAELTTDHPVVSISIGCPCIFLLGGLNKEERPLPILLRSGDVLFMGVNSRLRYHGVPKVLISEGPPLYLQPPSISDNENIHYCTCPCFLEINNVNNDENNNDNDNDNDNTRSLEKEEEDALPRKRIRTSKNICSCGTFKNNEICRALKYLQITRFNLNVRQVYPNDDKRCDPSTK